MESWACDDEACSTLLHTAGSFRDPTCPSGSQGLVAHDCVLRSTQHTEAVGVQQSCAGVVYLDASVQPEQPVLLYVVSCFCAINCSWATGLWPADVSIKLVERALY